MIYNEPIPVKKYSGYIVTDPSDREYLRGIDLDQKHLFSITGFWTAGSREISSYQLCDKNGDTIEALAHLQFSRDKNNRFYLEAVN